MKEDQLRFLSLLGQLPARLTAEQTGWVLNCQPHDIPALVAAKLLKPLGNPAPNATKFFATVDILEMLKDRPQLAKITNAIQHSTGNERMPAGKSICAAKRKMKVFCAIDSAKMDGGR